MTFAFLIGIVAFIFSVSQYGLLLAKIRSYLKTNKYELYEKYHLDLTSLMLGPGEVDWNFQMFVLKKQYLSVKDEKLIELCDKAYNWGVVVFGSFLLLFVTLIINSVVGS